MQTHPMTASEKAAKTARWATTMTRWAIRYATIGTHGGSAVKRWQVIGFPGPAGSESRGIVDLLAIRRDHRTTNDVLNRGDLFEMLLIQVKGGSAPWPTESDLARLLAVQEYYRAKHVVLAAWLKGNEPDFYVMAGMGADGTGDWRKKSAAEIFGFVGAAESTDNACNYCGKDHAEEPTCPEFEARRNRFVWHEGDIKFMHEAPAPAGERDT